MLSPVEEAIEWLDAMNGRNERRSAALAAKWGRDGEWGWAVHAAGSSQNTAASSRKAAEAAALKALPVMREAMKGPPALWVPKWVEFWRIYGVTEAAAPLVQGYLGQRGRQRETAARLFAKVQTLFNEKKSVEANGVLQNLRDQTPNTYQGFFAMQWLASKR
ncbi:MAG: hypothetical protein EOP85_21125 [Verrucomicrobiaceae bacterium]|nr:MAG: hypothetical protein EOP85_21125 [Verrucomicrobiaceae bacterium]